MALKKKKAKILEHKRKLIAKFEPKSPITEQFRTIRTNIQFSSADKEVQTIMVTSAGPAAGKSTIIANLAVVFAQAGKSVLLIDSDLRKPTVHFTFNLTNTFGITSVLTRQMQFMDAIVESGEENLFILPSGPIPPNPAELLGSKSMDLLIEKAKDEFDMILFDTPPVLAVTDAQILANKCDGTIYAISSGKTGKDEAVKAKELLIAADAKIMGVVLNNKKAQDSPYMYYYGAN